MALKYVDHTNTVSDETLLADLISVANTLEQNKVTISDYTTYGKYNPSTIMRHFQTWNHALELAGLQISNKTYTLQELYDNLADVWLKLGHQPSRRDLAIVHSPISYKAYERQFGKWSLALKSFVDYYNSSDDSSTISNVIETRSTIHRTSRDVSLRIRFLVMQRDHFKCCICGASPASNPSVELQIDHIVPWARGGETSIDNLQTLCSKCNLGKSNLRF